MVGETRSRIQNLGGNASYSVYLKIYLFVDKSRFSLRDQGFHILKHFSFLYISQNVAYVKGPFLLSCSCILELSCLHSFS